MEICRGGDFLFSKNTADDIGSFTAVCVVGVLGAIHCISANICVGHVRYCFLFNVVYFFVCTLKNSKTKRGGVAD